MIRFIAFTVLLTILPISPTESFVSNPNRGRRYFKKINVGNLTPPANVTLKLRAGGVVNSFVGTRLNRYADTLFENSDIDKDGSISPTEAYNLVLLLYIKVNQKVPISPPSREKVQNVFNRQDQGRKGKLVKAEFKDLVRILLKRTTARVVTYKTLSLFAAPLLAMQVVSGLSGKVWLYDLGVKYVPQRFAGMALTRQFWTSVLTVVFISTLGSMGLMVIDLFIERVAHMNEKKRQGTEAAAGESSNLNK